MRRRIQNEMKRKNFERKENIQDVPNNNLTFFLSFLSGLDFFSFLSREHVPVSNILLLLVITSATENLRMSWL